jgi:predicted ester cyclase
MTNEPEGVRIVRRMLDEGFAGGRTEVADELCAPDMVGHQFGLRGGGAEAIAKLKKAITEVSSMSEDLVYTIEDWAERDGVVWVRSTGRGTFTGPFFGPPSGRSFELTVIDAVRIVDGRVAEHWGVPDRFALLVQAGLLERLARP